MPEHSVEQPRPDLSAALFVAWDVFRLIYCQFHPPAAMLMVATCSHSGAYQFPHAAAYPCGGP
jgi:hypothetical protein